MLLLMVDKYWPRDIAEPEQKVSLLNEPLIFRDTGNAAVLRKWPKARPLHAVIAECLANIELLLAQLEAGVRVYAAAARGAGSGLAAGRAGIEHYFQLSDGPKSRSSFCRVSRRVPQYFTNKSGP